MAIRIPKGGKSKRYEPLIRCVKNAASRMGVNEFFATNFMTYFLEQVVDEVVDGQAVYIPGFGVFVPGINHRSKFKKFAKEVRFCVPKFAASSGFRVQVKEECDIQKCREEDYKRYVGSSSPSIKHKQGRRVAKSMSRLREAVTEQAERVCMDAGPPSARKDPRKIPGILP